MATIEITHTAADGTLVAGDTEKGDGTGDILNAHGFRWFRSMGQYGVPRSRDRAPRLVAMEQAATALRAAGHTVTVAVDGVVRDNATVRAAQHERLEDRRTALEGKAEKLTRESAALHKASDAMIEHIPMGQPVAPGAKGRAHRNLLDRSINTVIKAGHVAQEAEGIPDRIAGSRRAEAHKERPDVTARRVARLETELRALDRRMSRLAEYPHTDSPTLREQYAGERAVLVERIAGDRAVLDAAKAAGTFGQYSKDNVHKGDQVHVRGQWRTVVRASAKSVSVTTGYSWTDRYGYEEIRAVRYAPTQD